MPTISEFYGIKIMMWTHERHGAHFHVRYAEYKAQISIRDGRVLRGGLPPRAYHLVLQWFALHRAELVENWNRVRQGESPRRIQPLR